MPFDPYLDEFPGEETVPRSQSNLPQNAAPSRSSLDHDLRSWWVVAWENLSRMGLSELSMRLGTNALLVALILLVAWGMRIFYTGANVGDLQNRAAFAAGLPTPTSPAPDPDLPPLNDQGEASQGIARLVSIHTDVPSRARQEMLRYTVEPGDTLFGIAEKFGLKPETILWGNQLTLGDNPHSLRPGQQLNILPVDGAYHKWSAGDGLNGVAKFFGVSPEAIIDFPGNHLSRETIGDYANPNIEPGTWLIIPGGRREFISWSAPEIPRDKLSVASVLGPGACKSIAANAVIGTGAFIWPADHHFLSGFDFNPAVNHYGIDIDGDLGNPVYAADNGVVVYAGVNNWGYGNVVVINHGNGWQTLYAHLNAMNVNCGQSVSQGYVIGTIGSTGNATGPHLHFEMMYNGARVDPHDYLTK